MEFTDWSQMRQFDEPIQPEKQKDEGDNAGSNKSDKPAASFEAKKTKEEKIVIDLTSVDDKTDLASMEVTDWNDLRKFDDDHDVDWFSCQEKKLAEQYGGNFIKVKYADHGRVTYFCELCVAECNAKKSLELHCSGMKHLKKKDIWEKEGKPHLQGGLGIRKSDVGPNPSNEPLQKRMPIRNRRDRTPPPPRRRDELSRSRSHDRRPNWDRGRRSPSFSPERHSFDRYSPKEYFRDSYDGSRGPPPFSKGRYSPPPTDSWSRQGRNGRDRYDETPSRRASSPDRYRRDFRDGRGYHPDPLDSTPCPPSPPRFGGLKSFGQDKLNLASSPAANLLQKLSECCVKTTEDADLAMNVVASLTRSLKEYSQRSGEIKIAELLMEAELKIGTVKALKVGMKMLSSFAESAQPSKSNTHGEGSFQKRDQGMGGGDFASSLMGKMMDQASNCPPMGDMRAYPHGPGGRSDPFLDSERPMAFNPPPPHSNMPWM